jgi:hypothetical protein
MHVLFTDLMVYVNLMDLASCDVLNSVVVMLGSVGGPTDEANAKNVGYIILIRFASGKGHRMQRNIDRFLEVIVGEYGLRKRYATAGLVANFGPRTKKGFCRVCNKDLVITLMLIGLCECCFAGVFPTIGDPEGCRPSAPKVRMSRKRHASGTLRYREEGGSGGTPQRPDVVGAVSWTGSVPKVRRGRRPWLYRGKGGAATRGCVGCVKRSRTKQRHDAPRGKVAWPYEDTLEACKKRRVTVIPL